MSVSELHPVVCLLLACLAYVGAVMADSTGRVFWRTDPDQQPGTDGEGSVAFCRTIALAAWAFAAICWLLVAMYALAGLYPIMGVLYRWLVL